MTGCSEDESDSPSLDSNDSPTENDHSNNAAVPWQCEQIDIRSALETRRKLPTTVRLEDGRVLVIGGTVPLDETADDGPAVQSLSAPELIDPFDDEVVSIDDSMEAHSIQSVIELSDGTVLASGAIDAEAGEPSVAVELFDPQSETWTLIDIFASEMRRPVEVSDGSVLFVSQFPRRYDPGPQVIEDVAPLASEYQSPNVHALPEGRVLRLGTTTAAGAGTEEEPVGRIGGELYNSSTTP